MGVVDDLADALAKDAIASAIGNDDVIYETATILEATSATMQESYMTSVRVRLAERRAREFLAGKLPPDVDEI